MTLAIARTVFTFSLCALVVWVVWHLWPDVFYRVCRSVTDRLIEVLNQPDQPSEKSSAEIRQLQMRGRMRSRANTEKGLKELLNENRRQDHLYYGIRKGDQFSVDTNHRQRACIQLCHVVRSLVVQAPSDELVLPSHQFTAEGILIAVHALRGTLGSTVESKAPDHAAGNRDPLRVVRESPLSLSEAREILGAVALAFLLAQKSGPKAGDDSSSTIGSPVPDET